LAEPSLALIRRAQNGDRDALNELVISQQQYVYSIAMSVLHHPDDASDLTQEAFVRLFRSIRQYNGESRFTTWLYRLVVNLGRDELRRRGRQVPELSGPTDDDDLDPVTLIVDEVDERDPQQALENAETRRMLNECLELLDPQYRMALTLYYFHDKKYNDIADAMGIPLNTVKSHIRRGKERMFELMREMHPELQESDHGGLL
jgi:RNA polymerase sigma-70 factor (ECF subfamily)